MRAPLLASIGTTHPWNVAGVGLDGYVASEYGLTHVMAIAAVSAQDEGGVRALHAVPPEVFDAQLRALPEDVAAYRVGALVSPENVRTVAAFLEERAGQVPVIVDPVMSATLGGEIRTGASFGAVLSEELLRLPVIVTPNIPEAESLLGTSLRSIEDLRDAAARFVQRGARAALVKGGHLAGDPVDVLATASGIWEFRAARLNGSMRGSGCTLAASLACELARGRELPAAAEAARAYVRKKIAARTMRGALQVAF